MQNVVGLTLVAMETKFRLGVEIQSTTGLSSCFLAYEHFVEKFRHVVLVGARHLVLFNGQLKVEHLMISPNYIYTVCGE